MFGKKTRTTAKSGHDEFSKHERFTPRDLKALVDGVACQVLDYSDGGVRLTAIAGLRRTALIEVFKGDRLLKKVPAVIAWERGGQIGYAFRGNLSVYEIDSSERHPGGRRDRAPEEATHNDAGGVSGSALRKRLNLR